MGAKTDRGYVVVTGTSTGIGEATALHLVEQGFHVFAGVRQEADGDALRVQAPKRLTPLIVDVTDEAAIAAAAASVTKTVGNRGLAGLVNNAGIGVPAPIEFQPMADFREQLEVNLFGPVAMIQAFLPLIRRGGGRIVNVGSIGGMLVLPINGAYSASKFGMRAISDALRLELRQWNIHVSLIEVAPVKTAIFGKSFAGARRARADDRERGLRALREADRRDPEGRGRRGGERGSAARHREGHPSRLDVGQAEDEILGRPRRQADRRRRCATRSSARSRARARARASEAGIARGTNWDREERA